jgi:hypothetical protein
VCAALGLDTTAYTDAYVLGWADGDLDLVQQCATTVLSVAKSILADLTPTDIDADGDAAALGDPAEPLAGTPGTLVVNGAGR